VEPVGNRISTMLSQNAMRNRKNIVPCPRGRYRRFPVQTSRQH
jgi:hypothetical protein